MKKGFKILVFVGVSILLVLLIASLYSSSWKYKSQKAEEAAIYLGEYYNSNGIYPSQKEFYKEFPKKLIYDNREYSKPSFILEYKSNRVHEDAYGTPYHFNQLFESHIRYYISSCDTARRCTWLDFQERNSPKGVGYSQIVIHDKSEPYYYVHPYFQALYENDPNLKGYLIPNKKTSQTRFTEAKEGETYLYNNLSYDASFFEVIEFDERGYEDSSKSFHITEFSGTGKTGKTNISYDLIHCDNITINDCDNFSTHIVIPIEIYDRE